MKKFIFLLLILPLATTAQNNHAIDSLKILLNKAKVDTQKINLLNKIGNLLINTKGIEGVKYADAAIAQSEKTGFKKGLAQGYANRGEMLFNTNNPDLAKSDLETAIKFYKQTNELAGLALTYNTLGRLVRVQGNLSDAIVHFQQAADIYEQINDQEGISDCLVFIGNNYNQMGQYDKALGMYLQAYAIRLKLNNTNKIAQTLAGIGMTYRNKQLDAADAKNFKLAIQYMLKARQAFFKIDHRLNIALIDKEIGVTYQFQHIYKDALFYLLEAQDRFKKIDYKREQGALYKSIGRCYLDLNQYTQAKIYFEKGLNASVAEKYQQHIMESYEAFYDLYKAIGNDKMSLQYHEKWMDEKDSLIKRTNFAKLADLNTKYEAEKKEQQINLLNKENTIQKLSISKQKTTIGIIAGILLALVIFGGLLYNRNKHKQKIALQQQMLKQQRHLTQAIIDAEEKERKRIASDLHDGVGQMFSAVKLNLSGLVDRIKFERDEDRFLAEKTIALVDESCKEVRVISHQMMPNMLLRSGIASDVKSFIEKIDSESLKVNVEAIGFKNKLESNVEIVLYRVIQETVNNVIKHAKATELNILLNRDTSGIHAVIADNGIGFNTDLKEDFAGIGLKNIVARIEYLKGTVTYKSSANKGTSVNIWVPVG